MPVYNYGVPVYLEQLTGLVAYNDSLRMVLGIPRYCSERMFAYTNGQVAMCHTSKYIRFMSNV